MPYVRTVKAASGAPAVQIVYSFHRGSRDIEHIGSAHDDVELELLEEVARQRLAAGQRLRGLHRRTRAHLIRPDRKDEPARFGKLARQRQWIEAIFDPERPAHPRRPRQPRPGRVAAPVAARLLALAAAIWHNWRTGTPVKRSLVAYDH